MYVTRQIQNIINKKNNSIHKRSIFRQMLNTCDKLGNSFLTKEEIKQLNLK